MKKSIISALAISAVCSFNLMAATPSFDSVQVGYAHIKDDGLSAKGYELGVSTMLTEQLFVEASHVSVSDDLVMFSETFDTDFDLTKASIGYQQELFDSVHFFATAGIVHFNYKVKAVVEDEVFSGSDDDTGLSLSIGARTMVAQSVELGWRTSMDRLYSDNEWTHSLTASYHFTPALSLKGRVDFGDLEGYGVALAYHF